jgi:hypothetical protein
MLYYPIVIAIALVAGAFAGKFAFRHSLRNKQTRTGSIVQAGLAAVLAFIVVLGLGHGLMFFIGYGLYG